MEELLEVTLFTKNNIFEETEEYQSDLSMKQWIGIITILFLPIINAVLAVKWANGYAPHGILVNFGRAQVLVQATFVILFTLLKVFVK